MRILLQHAGCVLVQRVSAADLLEEEQDADDDALEVQRGGPVLPQDVQADLALAVDVRVEDAAQKTHLGRFDRIRFAESQLEGEVSAPVEALIGRYDES